MNKLKCIDLRIARNQELVITDLSGLSKSCITFDTLHAEGQRRYAESLSTHGHRFLQRINKPDVGIIERVRFASPVNSDKLFFMPYRYDTAR
jgi:excinuclease ABC subunit A